MDFGELNGENHPGLDLIEFFSGVSRVARFAKRCGLHSRAYEIQFDHGRKRFRWSTHNRQKKRSFMDINGEAGFVLLGSPSVLGHHCKTKLHKTMIQLGKPS